VPEAELEDMFDRVFEFEEQTMPLPVLLSAVGLIMLFVLGIAYRLVAFVAF
jgi:hypothetical protein